MVQSKKTKQSSFRSIKEVKAALLPNLLAAEEEREFYRSIELSIPKAKLIIQKREIEKPE